MVNRQGNKGNNDRLYFPGLQNHCGPWLQLDSILKRRDITLLTKVWLVKVMVFPVVMYGYENWAIKKSWVLNNWCFWTVVLEKTLESPLDCKESKLVNPKGNQSWCSLEGLILKLKLQYLGHLMQRTDSLEKTLMLGKIEGRRRRGQQGWDGWMASLTLWTWVWTSFRSWWWTWTPGVLQSMGSQRVRHDWATELNWKSLRISFHCNMRSRSKILSSKWGPSGKMSP